MFKKDAGAQRAQTLSAQEKCGMMLHIHQSQRRAHSHGLSSLCYPDFLSLHNLADKSEATNDEGRWGFYVKDGSESKSQLANRMLKKEDKGDIP